MGLFKLWKRRRRKAFVDKAEALAGSIQMEMYKRSEVALSGRLGNETAGKIASAIANYVFRFGYVHPQHASEEGLLQLCEAERPAMLASFGDVFKTNATGVLILLGAAWELDMDAFKKHLANLATEGFAKVGRETPDVKRDLPDEAQAYCYEVAMIGRENQHEPIAPKSALSPDTQKPRTG